MRYRAPVLQALIVAALTVGCADIHEPLDPIESLQGAHSPGHSPQSSMVSAGPALGLQLVAEGLTAPVALVPATDGSGRLFVADQVGLIRIVEDGMLRPVPFLDVRAQMVELTPNFDERGLLGLALHPEFASNGRFFVYYSVPPRLADYNHTSRVAEFLVSADPNVADAASETIILEVDQPQFNHNAGMLAFGPDGFLYIALGDGGGADDTGFGHVEDWYEANEGGNGQAFDQNLLGSILRIDVDGGSPYAVPPDNPFVGSAGLDEIWAFGFRNPWRMSFDMGGSRALMVADVGQLLWEEVNTVVRGGNYGWNVKEGLSCFNAADNTSPFNACPAHDPRGEPLLDPVVVYANSFQPGGLGTAVVGGFVYRGNDVPQLRGRYIFGDWSTSFGAPDGSIFLANPGGSLWRIQRIGFPDRGGRIGHYVLGFGQDTAGEVYVLTSDTAGPSGESGRVYLLTRPGRGR